MPVYACRMAIGARSFATPTNYPATRRRQIGWAQTRGDVVKQSGALDLTPRFFMDQGW